MQHGRANTLIPKSDIPSSSSLSAFERSIGVTAHVMGLNVASPSGLPSVDSGKYSRWTRKLSSKGKFNSTYEQIGQGRDTYI